MAESLLWLKFRHVNGDIGPYEISSKASIASIKEKLCQGWPEGRIEFCFMISNTRPAALVDLYKTAALETAIGTYLTSHLFFSFTVPMSDSSHRLGLADGPLAKDKPATAAEIRLICSGKYIETTSNLKGRSCLQRTHFNCNDVHRLDILCLFFILCSCFEIFRTSYTRCPNNDASCH